jgi:hypothetical protein
MRDLAETVRRLAAYAERGGAPRAWLAVAGTDLVEALVELARLRERTDRRHLAVHDEVVKVARALERCDGDARRARAQFRHLDKWRWARRVASAAQLLGRKLTGSTPTGATNIMATKNLKTANDPVSFPTGGKPSVPPELKTAPRASGAAATGETEGNYEPPAANNFGLPVKDAAK